MQEEQLDLFFQDLNSIWFCILFFKGGLASHHWNLSAVLSLCSAHAGTPEGRCEFPNAQSLGIARKKLT